MTTSAERITAASGISELVAEAERARVAYGDDALVVCDRLVRIFTAEKIEVQALQGLDLLINEGELTAMVGASGSGKSTLMNILAGLDSPTAGTVKVAGRDLASMSARERLVYRRDVVGFIWQQTSRNLLPYLTAIQNVVMPMRFSGVSRQARSARAAELLGVLGIAHCADRRPDQMSGGEQQRTAIATALANKPDLLLADEPTGELDSTTAHEILALLRKVNDQLGLTIILVTHDVTIAADLDRTIAIRDGKTSTETVRRDAPLRVEGELARMASAIIGLPGETHRESVLIDRVGRLQLPEEALHRVAFNGRAEVRSYDDHVEIWPLGDGK